MADPDYGPFLAARIEAVWIVWNRSWAEIEQSSPVVVVTDRGQLEFCAAYVSEFESSIGTVDVTQLPSNYDGSELDLRWTADQTAPQIAARAQRIISIDPLPDSRPGVVVWHTGGGFVAVNEVDEMRFVDAADYGPTAGMTGPAPSDDA